MGSYLLCSSPFYGHVAPMVAIGRDLAGHRHRVRLMTGARFAGKVKDAGLEFVPLPAECDFDDRDLNATFPKRAALKNVARLRHDMTTVFIGALPYQYLAVADQLAADPADAVLSELGFMGLVPLLMKPVGSRPPVIIGGILPLSQFSRDTAPFGLGLLPVPTMLGRLRNRILNGLVRQVIFRPCQVAFQRHVYDVTGIRVTKFFLNWAAVAEHFLQFTCVGFEYPRTDLAGNLRFVGPILPRPAGDFVDPDWWADLAVGRPVVHVTQGTVDNKELDRLLGPTIRALADKDVFVVATTGGQPLPETMLPLPGNVRVADFIPYDRLLPVVDIMVTNGGYGGVSHALSHGVPLVVAGDREDKPEVANRVAWTGAGINLRTGTPEPAAISNAVDALFADQTYRTAAQKLATEFGHYSALETVREVLEQYATPAAPQGWPADPAGEQSGQAPAE